jgi:hypothetical protein
MPAMGLQNRWTSKAALVNHDKSQDWRPMKNKLQRLLSECVRFRTRWQFSMQHDRQWRASHGFFITPT